MNDHPIVSIVIPTFNQALLLSETLDSVLSQSFKNWECLVVDDGSTEDNVEIAYQYATNDGRFKLLERTKLTKIKGANTCRNIGIEHALGEYIMFLDSDDLLFPYCLEERLSTFSQNSEYDFIVFQMATGENLNVIKNKNLTQFKDNYLYAFLSHDNPWQTSAVLIKKEILSNDLLFDESFPRIQDPEFYTKILLKDDIKFKVFTDRKFDAVYRLTNNRKTNYLNGVTGFRLYITKFYKLTKNRLDSDLCLDSLIKCYKLAVNQYYLKRKPQTINIKEKKELLKLTWFMYQKKLINYKDFAILSLKISYSGF